MDALHKLGILLLIAAVLVACGQSAPDADTTTTPTEVPPRPSQDPTTASTATTPTTAVPTPTYTVPAGTAAVADLSGTVVIDGSSTVFPITEAAAIAFNAFAPDVRVQLGVSGTGGGFAKFCVGETDISDASRPIKAEEAELCADNGIEFIELPVAFDGISIVVHPENDWADCMTVSELQQLWAPDSEITHWDQIHADFPDREIQLYGPGRDSGTFDYFTSAIVGEEGVSTDDFIGSEDDYLIAQDVASDPNGLGFFGYAYYIELQDRLNIMAVDAGTGCVEPTEASIAEGSYQPLSRPIFIYVRNDALDRPAVAAFVDFYLANATSFVSHVRYVPLPMRAYELAQRRIEQRILGSVFDGGSQVGVSIEELLAIEDQ
jgi:phosphate transport system substrate-binding protein